MEFDPQVVAQDIYNTYPPSRHQLMRLMRRHTIQQIVYEYMADAYEEEKKDSTRVVDVTNKLWDLLHK